MEGVYKITYFKSAISDTDFLYIIFIPKLYGEKKKKGKKKKFVIQVSNIFFQL